MSVPWKHAREKNGVHLFVFLHKECEEPADLHCREIYAHVCGSVCTDRTGSRVSNLADAAVSDLPYTVNMSDTNPEVE